MRRCPFNDCGRVIPDSMFACRGHWFSLSPVERDAIHTAYDAYLARCIGLEELRGQQQAVLGPRGQAVNADL